MTSVQRWVVDSIEENVASIEVDGTTMITIPVSLLPKSAKQGDILSVRAERGSSEHGVTLSIEQDPAATASARARSAAQVSKGSPQQNDPGGNIAF